MADGYKSPPNGNFIQQIFRDARDWFRDLFDGFRASVDLSGKIVLLDNDELILVWEKELRELRLKKEEDAWNKYEQQYGVGSHKVTEAFVAWQEKLYAYIEQEKDRFLKQRQGSARGLNELLRAGAKNIIVTKGARPYTQKCFSLVGLSASISQIYSPGPGKRSKRFVDAAVDYGKQTPALCAKDVLIVGHDLDKDMGWDLAPSRGHHNDGKAPIFVMFSTLRFEAEVDDPLDALWEIAMLLARRGNNDFLQGFNAIDAPEKAVTKNYVFKKALWRHPTRTDKARIPVIYDIKPRR